MNTPSGKPACFIRSATIKRGARVGGRRLEHKGVARGDRHREHPHGHHDGEVERRDAGDHAQGLAQGPVVDAGGDLLGVVALEQLRHAAGEFDDVDAALDLALGVGEHLAVLQRDGLGQRVLVLVEQAQELVHQPRAADRGHVGPGGEGGLGGGHSSVHIGHVGQRHLAGDFAGGGVEHVLGAAGGAGGGCACDVVLDGGDGHGVSFVEIQSGVWPQCRNRTATIQPCFPELIVQNGEQ